MARSIIIPRFSCPRRILHIPPLGRETDHGDRDCWHSSTFATFGNAETGSSSVQAAAKDDGSATRPGSFGSSASAGYFPVDGRRIGWTMEQPSQLEPERDYTGWSGRCCLLECRGRYDRPGRWFANGPVRPFPEHRGQRVLDHRRRVGGHRPYAERQRHESDRRSDRGRERDGGPRDADREAHWTATRASWRARWWSNTTTVWGRRLGRPRSRAMRPWPCTERPCRSPRI